MEQPFESVTLATLNAGRRRADEGNGLPGGRHHVVSRGYLRGFADGERLRLFDKTTLAPLPRPVGTADAFVEAGFNAVLTDDGWTEAPEREWARIEGLVLPLIRALNAGDRSDEARLGARVLAAIHFARSYSFRDTHDRIMDETLAERPDVLDSEADLTEAFEADEGRPPEPGEIGALVAEALSEWRSSRQFFHERMVSIYTQALDRLGELHRQLIGPISRHGEFVTGDTPVVLISGVRVTGLAFMDAEQVFLPLGRRLAAFFTTQPEDDQLAAPFVVQMLNRLTYRAANRFVAHHPTLDPYRAMALP